MELGDLVSRVGLYLDPLAIFKIPFPLDVELAFFDVSFQVWMYDEGNILLVLLDEYVVEVNLDIVQQKDRWAHSACSVASWAEFAGHDIHFRANTLTGNLHQAEFAWW